MPDRNGTIKKFAALSLLVLGGGAYTMLRAGNTCNSYYMGRCEQWCTDHNHGHSMSCHVNVLDHPVCVCSQDGTHTFS